MKTIEKIKLAKGYYVNVRYNGMTISNTFFKTKKDAEANIKMWKAQGYELSK